jgi:hypothetical protein
MVLRKKFGPVRQEVRGDWKNLHNEERQNFNFCLNLTKLIKNKGG